MLLDIFSFRYENKEIRSSYDERDKRFFRAIFYLLSKDIFPYYDYKGGVNDVQKKRWKLLNENLSKELGLEFLSPIAYAYSTPKNGVVSGTNAYHTVCEKFLCEDYDGKQNPDLFVKDRMSFVELAFRAYQETQTYSKALGQYMSVVHNKNKSPALIKYEK